MNDRDERGARNGPDRAVYIISVAAELAGVHPQTLRIYEQKGLVRPHRTRGNTRRYSEADIERLRRVQRLTQDGVNLAGVKRIMAMEEEIHRLRDRIAQLEASLESRPIPMPGDRRGRGDRAARRASSRRRGAGARRELQLPRLAPPVAARGPRVPVGRPHAVGRTLGGLQRRRPPEAPRPRGEQRADLARRAAPRDRLGRASRRRDPGPAAGDGAAAGRVRDRHRDLRPDGARRTGSDGGRSVCSSRTCSTRRRRTACSSRPMSTTQRCGGSPSIWASASRGRSEDSCPRRTGRGTT